MSPDQCRTARERLNWTHEDLAVAANVPPSTIADYENKRAKLQPALLDQVRAFLEDVGFGFPFELSDGRAQPAGITYSPRDKGEMN